jgi:hypothetical protein
MPTSRLELENEPEDALKKLLGTEDRARNEETGGDEPEP